MKRKKDLLRKELSELVFIADKLSVSRESSEWYFEVGKEFTTDMAEAVALLMRNFDYNHSIWQTEINGVNAEDITPERSLFWLTGGYQEWRNLDNYNRPWYDCYLEFQEEFGFLIINIVKKAKRLSDIRDGFIKYLNLPVLYEFAISRDLVR